MVLNCFSCEETDYLVIETLSGKNGYGFWVDMVGGRFLVSKIDEKSAAQKAQLQAGHVIVEANGIDLTNSSFKDLAEIIKANNKILVLGVKNFENLEMDF